MMRAVHLQVLTAASVGLVAVAAAGTAAAQSVALPAEPIQERVNENGDRVDFRAQNREPLAVSKGDCEANIRLRYSVTTFPTDGTRTLEVWAGTSGACTEDRFRSATSGEANPCWLVWSGSPTRIPVTVDLPARSLVARPTTADSNINLDQRNAGVDVCSSKTAVWGVAGGTASLYFLEFSGNSLGSSAGPIDVKVDVAAAEAPTFEAVAAEDEAVFSWDTVVNSDVQGFNFYCAGTGTSDATSTSTQALGFGGNATAQSDGGTAGFTVIGSSESAGATNDGSGGDEECGNALVEGAAPDDAFLCGSTSTGSAASGMGTVTPGEITQVAMATVDLVGNVGPLSAPQCVRSTPVDDFYELYRNAGGDGGGGFCSIGRGSALDYWWLGAAAAALVVLRLRRRRDD